MEGKLELVSPEMLEVKGGREPLPRSHAQTPQLQFLPFQCFILKDTIKPEPLACLILSSPLTPVEPALWSLPRF